MLFPPMNPSTSSINEYGGCSYLTSLCASMSLGIVKGANFGAYQSGSDPISRWEIFAHATIDPFETTHKLNGGEILQP